MLGESMHLPSTVCVGVSVGVYVSGCVYSTVVGCIILMLCGVYTDEAE